MDRSDVDEALETAEAAFREPRDQRVETGLDVGDESLVQLRKACRLLTAARTLRRENGYYTVVIEASFVAIERSLQGFLLAQGYAVSRELRYGHTEVYERAAESNLCSEAFAARLTQLWERNRAAVYYQEAPATAAQATAMLSLAEAVHEYVLQSSSLGHECRCDDSP